MFCNLMKAMTITIIAMWAIEVTAAPQTTGTTDSPPARHH